MLQEDPALTYLQSAPEPPNSRSGRERAGGSRDDGARCRVKGLGCSQAWRVKWTMKWKQAPAGVQWAYKYTLLIPDSMFFLLVASTEGTTKNGSRERIGGICKDCSTTSELRTQTINPEPKP